MNEDHPDTFADVYAFLERARRDLDAQLRRSLPVDAAIARALAPDGQPEMDRQQRAAAALFDGARLTLARQLAGLSKSELAAMVGVSAAAVASWEFRKKRPLPATVRRLGTRLGVDPAFFAVWPRSLTAIDCPAHIRVLRTLTQRMRAQASAYAHLALDVTATIERHISLPVVAVPDTRVGRGAKQDAPGQAALRVRAVWDIRGPAANLVHLLETHGILVVFGAPQTAPVGAYALDAPKRPVAVLNPATTSFYTQRWELAVQLGHLVMHSGVGTIGADEDERAREFAAELLLPADDLRELLPDRLSSDAWLSLARLKEQWGVNLRQLLGRARQLGRLSDVSHRNAVATMKSRGWREREPGQASITERPSMLPRALSELIARGVSAPDLFGHTGIPPHLFAMIASPRPLGVMSTDSRVRSVLRRPDDAAP